MSWLKQTFSQTMEDQTLLKTLQDQGIQVDLQSLYGDIKSSIQQSVYQSYAGAPGSKNKWMLAGPPGTGALAPEEAVHLISLAIIQMAGKDQNARGTLQLSLRKVMENVVPDFEVQLLPASRGENDQLQITLDGNPLFSAQAFTHYLRTTPGYDAAVVSVQSQRGNQVDQLNVVRDIAGQGDNAYLDYTRKVGYLIHNTTLMIDNKQILVPFRGNLNTPNQAVGQNPEQTTYTDERGQQRYIDDDLSAEQPYGKKDNIWDKRGPSWEFSIGGPLRDRITELFPFLEGFRPTGDAEARKFSQRAAFIRLVQELGLETVVDMTPPPVNTNAKYIHLRQYANYIMQSLLRSAPQNVAPEQIKQAFTEGAQGKGFGVEIKERSRTKDAAPGQPVLV